MGLEDALDAVHGPSDDGEGSGGNAVRRELARGQRAQRGQGIERAVEAGTAGEAAQRGPEVGQQRGVGVALGQVARSRGCDGGPPHDQGRAQDHARAAPAFPRHQPTDAQGAIGGGHRGRAQAQGGGQGAHGGQQGSRREAALQDAALDAFRDLACAATGDPVLYRYVHCFVL